MRRRFEVLVAAFGFGFISSESNAQWRIDPKPVLDIGTAAGADEYLFKFVSGAVKLANGNIVVADANGPAIRIFDARGLYLKTVGRIGDGPGEYRSPEWLEVGRADTILLYDTRGSIGFLNKFTSDGRHVARRLIDGKTVAFNPLLLRYLPDGALIIDGQDRSAPGAEGDRPMGTAGRVPRALARNTDDRVELVLRFPGIALADRYAAWRVAGLVATSDSLVFLADGDTPTIRILGLVDRLARGSITSSEPRHNVTSEDIAKYQARVRERARTATPPPTSTLQGQIESAERRLAETTYPPNLPFFAEFKTDEPGNLWVRHAAAVGGQPTRWTVYSPTGSKLSDIELPAGLTVFQIGRDFVLGRWMDEDDVHHVQMYRLIK